MKENDKYGDRIGWKLDCEITIRDGVKRQHKNDFVQVVHSMKTK